MQRTAKRRRVNIFDVLNVTFFLILIFIMLFPIYSMMVTSFMTVAEYSATPLVFFPKEPTTIAYQFIFATGDITNALFVTVFITVVGTVLSMFFTLCLSYGLSKAFLPGGKIIFRLLLITMFLDTGLIPFYMMVRNLGFANNVFANIIPSLISLWNFLVIRSFFRELPQSIEEAALIDGASWFQLFVRVVLPISMPVIATFTLFYAVGYWNSWYNSYLFMQDPRFHTLQHVIRRMVVDKQTLWGMEYNFLNMMGERIAIFPESIRTAACVVAMVPIICVYPFLQKYFVKGVMIGSIKG